MKIFLEMFNGQIVGWSSSLENAPSIEINEDHDFLKNPSLYKLIEGELVKDDSSILETAKANKFKELSRKCEEEILGYFEATVDSVAFLFSFDREAQANFTGTLALFTEGLISNMEWTVQRNGVYERIILNKQQFLSVINVAFMHKNRNISHLRNDLQPLIDSAQTVEELENIVW